MMSAAGDRDCHGDNGNGLAVSRKGGIGRDRIAEPVGERRAAEIPAIAVKFPTQRNRECSFMYQGKFSRSRDFWIFHAENLKFWVFEF